MHQRAASSFALLACLGACASRVGASDAGAVDAPTRDVAPRVDTVLVGPPDVVPVEDAPLVPDASVPGCFDGVVRIADTEATDLHTVVAAEGVWLSWLETEGATPRGRYVVTLGDDGRPTGARTPMCSGAPIGSSLFMYLERNHPWIALGTNRDAARVEQCTDGAEARRTVLGGAPGELVYSVGPGTTPGTLRVLSYGGGLISITHIQTDGTRIRGLQSPYAEIEEVSEVAWNAEGPVLSHRLRDDSVEEIRLLAVVEQPTSVQLIPLRPIARPRGEAPGLPGAWVDQHSLAVGPNRYVAVNHSAPVAGTRGTTQEIVRASYATTAVGAPERLGSSVAWYAAESALAPLDRPGDFLAAWSANGGGGFDSVLHLAYSTLTGPVPPEARELRADPTGQGTIREVELAIDRPRRRALAVWSMSADAPAMNPLGRGLFVACIPLPE